MRKNFTIILDEDLQNELAKLQIQFILRGPQLSKGEIVRQAIRLGLPALRQQYSLRELESIEKESISDADVPTE